MASTLTAEVIRPALVAAAELAASGRALEAIDTLTALARQHRDPRLLRRLVHLRNDAFDEIVGPPGRSVWPPVVEDPFPAADGVPEIAADSLGASALSGAITHHGALLVRGLVDEATCAALCELIDRGYAARDRVAAGEDQAAVQPDWVQFRKGAASVKRFAAQSFVRVAELPDLCFDLVDLFAATGVTGAVAEHLGERPAMMAHKWVVRRQVGGKKLPDFHQDGAFLGEGIRTVDCWIALSACGPGTGCPGIEFLPRRVDHVLEVGGAAAFDWSLAEDVVMAASGGAALSAPTFAAGDALFFDELLPHRTGRGRSLGTRYAVESWFVAPSSYPDSHVPLVL